MTQSAPVTIRLHADDNVVVARADLLAGVRLEDEGVSVTDRVPVGHKVATRTIAAGEAVRKYDQIIGFACADIAAGAHVHTHNVEVHSFDRDPRIGEAVSDVDYVAEKARATFDGFVRADGSVGTRNYLGVISSVNCSSTVARYVADHFNRSGGLDDHPNVDGVVAIRHSSGCGMAGGGDGMDLFTRTIAGYARHPNFAGVVLIGLGCEAAQIGMIMDREGLEGSNALRTMTIQDSGGTRATVEAGIAAVTDMLGEANAQTRRPVPASELVLGMECGGSDAFSGITANPALGAAADLLVRHGGTAILGETPEIYGAEHLLTRRAVSPEVGDKLIGFIRWWEDYTERNGAEMNNNPSPGNKAGGLTTILEKSLGAAAKGGTTNLVDVYAYAEAVTEKGFVFMDTPGYDPVSVTGMVAGGANIVCFTTGRGSVFGCKPVPSLKLATNSAMYNRLEEDMDVNCGRVVDGDASIAGMGADIFQTILATASGHPSKSETLGIGDDEFIPWHIGAVM